MGDVRELTIDCKEGQREIWVLSQFSFIPLYYGWGCGQDGRERHEDYRTSRIFKIPWTTLQFLKYHRLLFTIE